MDLPKGTIKGLARVVAPLSFWMAAGWAAYAPMTERIYTSIDEAINIDEIRIFSMVMTVSCIAVGTVLAIYGFTGKEASDADIKALGIKSALCPYCGQALTPGSAQCEKCRNIMPATEKKY